MFAPLCERFKVCGSLRRGLPSIGDIEIVYIPRVVQVPKDGSLFGETEDCDLVDRQLSKLLAQGDLIKRRNKLAKLTRSGMPVDFFATTEKAWWTYICCRTGGAQSNTNLATTALEKGWKWHPMRGCFTSRKGDEVHWVTSEEENYTFLELPYLEPWKRA